MHNILSKIIVMKKHDLISRNLKIDLEMFQKEIKIKTKQDNKFRNAIINSKDIALIGEIKFASPMNINLGSREELLKRARSYEDAGACAISIITEKHFFKGNSKFVSKVKNYVDAPILQKDFVIDASQIYEAKQIGSDALLLIARLLDSETLKIFVDLCHDLNVEPVVEINNEEDLNKTILTATKFIAVNARDLETFVINIAAACRLLNKIPNKFIKLGFSGIVSKKEILQYKKAGVKGVLVGTSLMRAENAKDFIYSLCSDKKVKVKICGIQDLETAQKVITAGADFLGFNFVPTSKRYLDIKSAEKIVSKIKGKIKTVGVFQNAHFDEVNKIAKKLDLNFVQLHGNEDVEYREKINTKIIQKIHTDNGFINKENSEYFLLDRRIQGKGKMIDLPAAAKFSSNFFTFVAGGLTPENVGDVVSKVKPFAVDVASGIETNGTPDIKKIELFIKNAKGVNL